MKFLNASTDSPRAKDVKRMRLPLPNPGTDEYRLFYNHRDVEHEEPGEIDEATGQPAIATVLVPTADYVAASCDHEPTDAEWTECLTGAGYSAKEIKAILKGE